MCSNLRRKPSNNKFILITLKIRHTNIQPSGECLHVKWRSADANPLISAPPPPPPVKTRAKADQCVHFISNIQGRVGEIHCGSGAQQNQGARTPPAGTAGTARRSNQCGWNHSKRAVSSTEYDTPSVVQINLVFQSSSPFLKAKAVDVKWRFICFHFTANSLRVFELFSYRICSGRSTCPFQQRAV